MLAVGALALLTFVFTHYEGIRWNGPKAYFKSWIPEAPRALLFLIVFVISLVQARLLRTKWEY